MPTVIHGDFEWDSEKNESNALKHGIRFEEAIVVFTEDHYIGLPIVHRSGETRYFSIGLLEEKEITVFYTWREPRRRIISARRARHEEREIYRDYAGT